MLNRCCCMRLNTFGVVIGWIGIVGSFLAIILASVSLGYANEIAKAIAEGINNPEKVDDLTKVVILVGSFYLGFSVIGLLSSALLVIGTVKERHLLLLPWLINSGVGFLFNIIYQFYVLDMIASKGGSFGDMAPAIIATIFVIVFQFYIIYAIYSLYKQIQGNREQQAPLVRPTGPRYPRYTKI